jgi:hypothetical protein
MILNGVLDWVYNAEGTQLIQLSYAHCNPWTASDETLSAKRLFPGCQRGFCTILFLEFFLYPFSDS